MTNPHYGVNRGIPSKRDADLALNRLKIKYTTIVPRRVVENWIESVRDSVYSRLGTVSLTELINSIDYQMLRNAELRRINNTPADETPIDSVMDNINAFSHNRSPIQTQRIEQARKKASVKMGLNADNIQSAQHHAITESDKQRRRNTRKAIAKAMRIKKYIKRTMIIIGSIIVMVGILIGVNSF